MRRLFASVLALGLFTMLAAPSCKTVKKEDCVKSCHCRDLGLCSVVDGKCGAGTKTDCEQSRVCELIGKCSPDPDGECKALSDADCAMSNACNKHEQCTARDGICVR